MIIGINGKIGHGKDTVGRIIQYLTFCKDCNRTDVSYEDFINSAGWLSLWEIKKFAGKLKQIGSILTGIPVEKFEDQEFKLTNLPEEWSTLKQSGRSKVWIPMTVREFLQKLGTEAMRDGLHTNVWVNALFADYTLNQVWKTARELNSEVAGSVEEYPNWIITDMRFHNEMEAVKERDGVTVRVTRYKVGDKVYWTDPKSVSSGVYEIAEAYQDFCVIYNAYSEVQVMYNEIKHNTSSLHASETALDNAEFDYEIINVGTIEDLVEKVREILIKENIIK